MKQIFYSVTVVLLLAGWVFGAESGPKRAYLFTSFRDDGDGLHLAYSEDGLQWTDLNRVFLAPRVGSKLFRDPHILQGPDGVFRMVWTTGWNDKGIGYASSKDLMHWSEQKNIAVMEKEKAKNCWAPETFYDSKRGQYIITWSSDVEGRFTETVSQDRMNNRTYFVTTKDFTTFSDPKILLDPGFDHIDATIIESGGKYILTFKEGDMQKKGKSGPIHQAVADDPQGPYAVNKTPVVTQRAEGPTVAKIGDDYIMYFDFYSEGRYGAMKTRDFVTWTDISQQVQVVKGQRHGTVFAVLSDSVEKIKAVSQKLPPAPVLPGYHADPHAAVFDGTYYIYPTTDGYEGWGSTSFSCFSSKDLIHWENRGVILQLGVDVKWAQKNAWAPCIAQKNGKYFYYYSAQQQVGVAVADKPTGPFTDPLGKALVGRNAYRCQSIDPMVFVDDDGSAYLYFGQGKCNVVKLHEDMISYDPNEVRQITPPGYNEGSFVLKRNGKYYLMWSEFDTRDPRYSVAYATSDSPMGPFTKAKDNPILKAKDMVLGAGHHSVVQVPGKDEYYIVYHRFAIPDGTGYKRETCISPMRFDADGKILPVDVYESVSAVSK
jgi:beta-xylosidase